MELEAEPAERPLAKIRQAKRLLRAGEEILKVAEAMEEEFWSGLDDGLDESYTEIIRGLRKENDPEAAIIFSLRWQGWEICNDQELLLQEIAAFRRTGHEPRRGCPQGDRTVSIKGTMMPLERRNEPQMLRQFSKLYPSFNLNPLLRRRHQQLVEAQAFNEWLSNRRLRQEGETYADELGRMTEAVNRRIPQLRYAPAERAGVHRMARDVAAGRNTSESQVYGGLL